MNQPHLTTVRNMGPKQWVAQCLCGWSSVCELRRDARMAAEYHWLGEPLVTDVKMEQR